MLELLTDVLLRPGRAVSRLKGPGGALPASAAIFALYAASRVALQTLKPAGFPPETPGSFAVEAPGDWAFWVRVECYNLALTAAWIALAAYFTRLLGEGRLPKRILAAAASLGAPLALVLLEQMGLPRAAIAVAWLAVAAALGWVLRAFPRVLWAPLASLFLCVEAVPLAASPLLATAAALRWAGAYHAVEILAMFWTLGLAAFGLGRVAGIKTARAFLAVFLSSLAQILVLYGLHRLGLVPWQIVKGLMSV